jgi:hypothetical protein
MPVIPDYVWSWIQQFEAEMTNATSADETSMRRTSTAVEQVRMNEGRRLT